MKAVFGSVTRFCIICVFLYGLCGPVMVSASEGNIDSTNKYAWSENFGWQNFRPANGGVTVHDTYLTGFAWFENIGWIKLGCGTGPYDNTAADNWGVNRDGTGALSGFAWSENAGWINFNPASSQVTIDPTTGEFDGYAWGENTGWMHFKSPGLYGVVTDYRGGPATIPALNQWGMTALLLLMGIFAVRMMKKDRDRLRKCR